MLQLNDLRVNYGRVAAVQSLTLHVQEGEVVGLIGPNGAGKSTTLAAILGLVQPASGTLTFRGRSLIGLTPERIVRTGIALVPEGRQIFGTLTVAENLHLGQIARPADPHKDADLESVLDRFPILRTYYNSPAGRLSGGEQQQLAIARALLAKPRLLLLDEPSLGLAPLIVDLIFDTLVSLKQDGVTILLVEQNAARTIAFADRTYVLRSGQLVLSGSRAELEAHGDIAEAYLGLE